MPGGGKKGRKSGGGGGPPKQPEKEEREEQQPQQSNQNNQSQFKFDFGANAGQSAFAPVFDFSNPQNNMMLKAIQSKLGGLVGKNSGFYDTLPKIVKNRVRALKQLHKSKVEIDAEYKKARDELEKRFSEKYAPLYDKRAAYISGAVEPTAEEMGPEEEEKGVEIEEIKEGKEAKETSSEAIKGVPEFWLIAFKNHDGLGDVITEKDMEALKYLKDVKCKVFQDYVSPKGEKGKEKEKGKEEEEESDGPLHGFTLEFYFEENPFFEDKLLTKTYFLAYHLSEEMFHHAEATEIKWKPEKNLTIKKVTKQQKPKKKGGRRGSGKGQPMKTITVEEPQESFFNFFTPEGILGPAPEDMEEMEDEESLLEEDYQFGLEIKEALIPNAVLYFTGDIQPSFGFDFDEGEEDEEEEEGEDEEYAPNPNEKPAECKQQ